MPPPPNKGQKGKAFDRYTRQQVNEQMALMEQLMLTPGVTTSQQNGVMLQRFAVGPRRCQVLRERTRHVWVSQDDSARPADRASAVRRIMGMLNHARGQRSEDGQSWTRPPNHAAVVKYEALLADLQGTRMPVEVRVHHEVSTAVADVIGNLTADQLQEYFDEYAETQRKAAEFDARLLEAGE